MSRIRTFGASVIALAAGIGTAAAADLGYTPTPEVTYNPAPAFSWTGPYIGGLLGYGWGDAQIPGKDPTPSGIVGGVYGGYNFQAAPNFVLGVEGDITATGMSDTAGGVKVTNPWNGTFRGRAGYNWDRFLVYGTGGLAVGEVKTKAGGVSDSNTNVGWTLGAGVEAAITNNVTARVEYRYTDLGSTNFANVGKLDYTSNQVLTGIGLKF